MLCRLCKSEFPSQGTYKLTSSEVVISIRSNNHVELHCCESCGLVQVASSMNEQELSHLYENLDDSQFDEQEKCRIKSFRMDLSKLKPYLQKATNALEVGAMTGLGAKAIQLEFPNLEYQGIELSYSAVKKAKLKGYSIEQGGVGATLHKKDFDIVFAWDVIEHLENPHSFFYWLESYTKRTSKIFLTTPNWDSFWRRIFGKRWWFIMNMHRVYFTLETLSLMAGEHGWQVQASWPHKKKRSLRYTIIRFFLCFNVRMSPAIVNLIPDWELSLRSGQFGVLLIRKDSNVE